MAVISINVIDVRIPADEDRSDITGLVFLPDGRLVVCDNNNNRIKVLTNTFTVTDSLEVNFGPYDVAVVNSTSLVVTLPWKNQLQFVHMGTELRLGTTIAVGNRCWGVDVLGDTIYSSCHNSPQWGGEIRIYNVNGIFVRRIGLTDEQDGVGMYLMAPYYLTISKNTGNIYVSDYEFDRITRLSWNGSNIYQYFDPRLIRPRGLFLDAADNIFVCNSEAHSLDVITNTWRRYKSLLSFGDGLYNPYAVAYRASDATLVVSSNRNSNQMVVKLSN